MKRTFWLFGALLLIGTFIGAKLTLGQPASAQVVRTSQPETNRQTYVMAWGNFDVEQGVAGLYPKQFGDVVFVAAEHTPVKTGDVVLQVNDTLARQKVELAKIAIANAEKQLAEAKLLPRLYELQVEQQTAAVRAIDLEIEKVDRERKQKEEQAKSQEASSNLLKHVREQYDSGLKMLGEKKKAEQAKLAQIKLQDAKFKIEEAELDVQAKKVMLREAEELVKCYRVEAPGNGTVLRVHTRKGEVLGPNPRIYAVEFLPEAKVVVRAEVLQEWGRDVAVGKKVEIQDDTTMGQTWEGVVKSVSKWYAPTRSPIIEPFRFNDVRTLECIIDVTSGDAPKFIGQRVRAKIQK